MKLPIVKNVFLVLALLLTAPVIFAGLAGAQSKGVPQPQLEIEKLTLKTVQGSFEFDVEIADTNQERAMGLMFRETMPPRQGMLFDFQENQLVQMWMQNTPLSLDMVFIREDGTVATIATRTTPFSQAIISSGEPVGYVLEINAGIAGLIGLKEGDSVNHRFFDR